VSSEDALTFHKKKFDLTFLLKSYFATCSTFWNKIHAQPILTWSVLSTYEGVSKSFRTGRLEREL